MKQHLSIVDELCTACKTNKAKESITLKVLNFRHSFQDKYSVEERVRREKIKDIVSKFQVRVEEQSIRYEERKKREVKMEVSLPTIVEEKVSVDDSFKEMAELNAELSFDDEFSLSSRLKQI